MNKLVFSSLLLSTAAQAQVVECPKFYPWQDTQLAEVPYQHNGKGIVKKRALSGASGFIGEFNNAGELQGDIRKVKGGLDVGLPSETKWLVCWYGKTGDISWWEELKLGSKVTSCTLQIREGGKDPMDAKMTCK